MELVSLGIIILVIYLAVRGMASASAWLSGSRFRAYRMVATRYKGRYESRGLSDPPTVSFTHNDTNVRVGLAPNVPGQALGPRTRVVARYAKGIPFRMELAPIARKSPPQPPKGTRLVRTGVAEFDRAFVAQANDADMARAILAPAAMTSLIALQRLAPPAGMLLSINPERILLQIDRNLGQHGEALLLMVHHALILHDGLLAGVASRIGQGIEIVATGANEPEDGPAICKVCREPIAGPTVLCASCRTPHHRDCWEFVGSCSIYGCSGKQYLSV